MERAEEIYLSTLRKSMEKARQRRIAIDQSLTTVVNEKRDALTQLKQELADIQKGIHEKEKRLGQTEKRLRQAEEQLGQTKKRLRQAEEQLGQTDDPAKKIAFYNNFQEGYRRLTIVNLEAAANLENSIETLNEVLSDEKFMEKLETARSLTEIER